MAVTQGPASGNAEFFFGQTAGVEVQVPAGLVSLGPTATTSSTNPVDPNIGTSLQTQTRSTFVFGNTATVAFVNPA
jgi:hypothetical protein